MVHDSEFDFIVLTPAGAPDPSLAIAASRAGALGVLNLEFTDDAAAAAAALERFARYGRGRMGVQLDAESAGFASTILGQLAPAFDYVLLTNASTDRLAELTRSIHEHGRRVVLVCTNVEIAVSGESAGVDVLIAKGHEASGWVGEETTFVLLQHILGRVHLPVFAQGGVGMHTAAGCYVLGAAGAVLDGQVLLARESPLAPHVRARIATMDGSETAVVGGGFGGAFRAYSRPRLPMTEEIRQIETELLISNDSPRAVRQTWRTVIRGRVNWDNVDRSLLAIGQDAFFAPALARRFGTVGGILRAMRDAIGAHCAPAQEQRPLVEGSPLAQSHGTRYPILQGPMTRVSDRAQFAAAVAEAGALPFLALALMRAPEVKVLLDETKMLLGERPWGVGILGFVPPELRAEQLDVIRAQRPPFALIAGGRPDQSRLLEGEGIPTYLHVPSPGLLQMFLQEGAKRFIFEGRECGGHVGPRTSFVLWDSMIDVLLTHIQTGAQAADYHVIFAGGIQDGASAAAVAAIAGLLVQRGVRIGVLMGTAYLFTQEAVESGAIVEGFQAAALACEETVLLESGPGHATRCAPSPFCDDFNQERRKLLQSGLPPEEIRNHLEELNVGRLRMASKGLDRNPRFGLDPDAPKLAPVPEAQQRIQGMYMIGQVAALRQNVCTMAELHHDVSAGSTLRLATTLLPAEEDFSPPPPASVAIVGMACILPGAPNLPTFWSNVLNKVDAVGEVPASRWDWRLYYDPAKDAKDKAYSRWGGFIGDVPFDPLEFGMPPNTLPSIDPFQLLTLAVVRDALKDAGLLDRPFPRERTSVILGAGGGAGDLSIGYITRSSLPALFGEKAPEIVERLGSALPEWTEDSFPGILLNVAAGRVANRFDLGGVNFTVDAACASSLAAVYLGVRELENRTSDVSIVGGVDTLQSAFSFLAFSKTHALSPTGRCRTFDAQSDGIAIGEGLAVLVLKRLADAERDGDRVYGVIRGAAGSSDGRDRSLTAPRPEGQVRALRRAYAQAGFSPTTVGLIEAHGTGTVVGDQAEVQSLSTFFGESGALRQRCAIGSVKSMIGHTKATAGVAGLTKVALSLYHQVLPPTLGVIQPNPKANFPNSPFYVNSEARPWIHGEASHPRRAGVSAFGFGGTNFHIVVEEYTGSFLPEPHASVDPWPAELFVWRGRNRSDIATAVSDVVGKLDPGAQPRLADLAYTLALAAQAPPVGHQTLAVVASSLGELHDRLRKAIVFLQGNVERKHDPQGVHFADEPFKRGGGRVAFLFPGQGSQYVNMLRELSLAFPEIRHTFERADRLLADRLPQPLSRYVFPPPWFNPEEEQRYQAALTETDVAQSALGAADVALNYLLQNLGVAPELVAGHSYGEFVALAVAGCFDEETLFTLSEARGRFIREGAIAEAGTMAAVDSGPDALRPLLAEIDVTLANMNAPQQTVISGKRSNIERAIAICKEQGIRARLIPVACAFHSPLVAPAQQRLAALLRQVPLRSPRLEVFSNTTAAKYPSEPGEIADILAEHLVRPVEFVREIGAMYDAGARIFVEVGPRAVLGGLVSRIVGDRPHLAVALDQAGRPGIAQFLTGLAAVAAEGIPVRFDYLFRGRAVRKLDLAALERETGNVRYSPTTWLVDGGRARPTTASGGVIKTVTEPIRVAIIDNEKEDHASATSSDVGREQVENHPKLDAAGAAETTVLDGGVTAPPPVAATVPSTRPHVSPREVKSTHMQTMTPSAQAPPQLLTPDDGRHGESRAAPLVAASERTSDVVRQFQQVMQHFLETQRSVMLAYLQGQQGISSTVITLPPAPVTNGHTVGASEPHINGNSHPPGSNGGTVYGSRPSDVAARSVASPYTPPAPSEVVVPKVPAPRPMPDPVQEAPRASSPKPAPAPRPAPAPIAKPASAVVGALSKQQLTDRLLGVVSERTGYPPEMLGLDADLEADLGIDSIKRVEIVGTVVRTLALAEENQPEMEKLTTSRTLRQIVEQLSLAVEPLVAAGSRAGSAGRSSSEGDQRPFDSEATGPAIGRFSLRPVPAPAIDRRGTISPNGVILIVDDGAGVGNRLAEQLASAGHRSVRVVLGGDLQSEAPQFALPDSASPDEVSGLVDRIRQQVGPIVGLAHLAALRPGARTVPVDPTAWRERLAGDLRVLFFLLKATRADLEQAASEGGAVVLAATAMGGAYAFDQSSHSFFPGHGGIGGLLKTLAQEWMAIRVKSVDLDASPQDSVAAWLFDELCANDRLVEVGYQGGKRLRIEMVDDPVQRRGDPWRIDPTSVILVTGGARGITAATAIELAERYRPTLILVGRTPAPTHAEAVETAGVFDHIALKRAIIDQRRKAGLPLIPAVVEDAFQRLLHEREVRANLARLTETGSRVEYIAGDVRDTVAFGALIEDVYRRHGRIDGVIHGSGIIEDKLIRDKTAESFDRVMSTKVDSAVVLAQHLRPEQLKFLVFFSSISGRFGNRGQGDYSAASDVLNKLAQSLDRRWPGRIVSINWGPWHTVGMVSPEVQRQFAERGVELIPLADGCQKLLDELQFGRKGEVEIVVGGFPKGRGLSGDPIAIARK